MYLSKHTAIKNIILLILFFTLPINTFSLGLNPFQKEKDSLEIWISKSKSKDLNVNEKQKLLSKSFNYILDNKVSDPLKLSSIAYEFYKLNDSTNFFKTNKAALDLSLKLKDYYSEGDVNWNYATYYVNLEQYKLAFYHFNLAYKAFSKSKNKYETAKMLYGMAHVKGRFRDYTGSEILIIQAIKIFKELDNNKQLYLSYNHLGLLQEDIKEYDKGIKYYNKSLEYFNKNKDVLYAGTFNNMANIYLAQKKYNKALEYYKKDLKMDIDITHYARVIDNIGYTQLLLKDTTDVKNKLFNSLRIRDSLGNKIAITSSKIHISDYYEFTNDTLQAIKFATEANLLAKELKNGGDYLTTLQQLSDLQPKKSKKYLDRYIQFNDSLISEERRAQNKFTRIEFETDEHIEDNKRLTEQRVWIFAGSFAILLISTLLYFLRVQKVQNEKLQLEAEQQKANEEVYVLTLQQQAKLEEERVNERNRISAELHDGILGKLFGTRVSLGFLGMQMQPDTQEQHQTFLDELQNIEKEIRDVSHRLSENFDDATVNFTTIIEQLLRDKSVIGKFSHTFTYEPNISWKSINEVTKANVYRIIQEALQNIIKHANAKSVTLDFALQHQELLITISDDGVGFDTKKGKKGIGIKNIKTRVEKLSGSVDFSSEINQGTKLYIKIPYIPKNAA
ncbi:tetratricopeptide repeat protein [Tenacibaculum sp. 190524A05c]|uniref:Oxygen sensor histidine kinase NreB n=1 Tax=Tenacibaculum platacis TaxID=3137852 RepID=A0ABM9P5Z0_9FLAO